MTWLLKGLAKDYARELLHLDVRKKIVMLSALYLATVMGRKGKNRDKFFCWYEADSSGVFK